MARRMAQQQESQRDSSPEENPVVAKPIVAKAVPKNSYGGMVFAAIVSFIGAVCFAYQGYDKMTNYYNSENFASLNKNAYVGGDAYNYIINGNYATGFFVLTLVCVVIGFGFLILRQLKMNGDKLR